RESDSAAVPDVLPFVLEVVLPEAGQRLRTVDRNRLAALLHAPEGEGLALFELELARSRPNRMVGRQFHEWVVVLENVLHQRAEILVELPASTACLREEKAAVVDVLLQDFLLLVADAQIVAIEEQDRRLQQFGRQVAALVVAVGRLAAHVEHLPGQRLVLEQLLAGKLNQVPHVAALVVPAEVVPVAVRQFADQDRRPALGQKQERETG